VLSHCFDAWNNIFDVLYRHGVYFSRYVAVGGSPLVFIVSDSTSGESTERLLFPKHLQDQLRITNIRYDQASCIKLIQLVVFYLRTGVWSYCQTDWCINITLKHFVKYRKRKRKHDMYWIDYLTSTKMSVFRYSYLLKPRIWIILLRSKTVHLLLCLLDNYCVL